MPARDLPPYFACPNGDIWLRKYSKCSKNGRLYEWYGRVGPKNTENLILAWQMFALIQDIEQYGKYHPSNTKFYDPLTYAHFDEEFINRFVAIQRDSKDNSFREAALRKIQAAQTKHKECVNSCTDTRLLLRDIDPNRYLQARKNLRNKIFRKTELLQRHRNQIRLSSLPNAGAYYDFTGSLATIPKADRKIDALLQQPSLRRIYIGNRKFKTTSLLKIAKCGPRYRVHAMQGQNQVIASRTIPAGTILALYHFQCMPIEDYAKLHEHPLVNRQHSSYSFHIKLKSISETDLEESLQV